MYDLFHQYQTFTHIGACISTDKLLMPNDYYSLIFNTHPTKMGGSYGVASDVQLSAFSFRADHIKKIQILAIIIFNMPDIWQTVPDT